jgi:hypothetical protein
VANSGNQLSRASLLMAAGCAGLLLCAYTTTAAPSTPHATRRPPHPALSRSACHQLTAPCRVTNKLFSYIKRRSEAPAGSPLSSY